MTSAFLVCEDRVKRYHLTTIQAVDLIVYRHVCFLIRNDVLKSHWGDSDMREERILY